MKNDGKIEGMNLGLSVADQHSSLLQFGEFVLDRQQLVLWHGEEPVHLTGKAFRTLVLLIVNRGKTLSRDFLLDNAWTDVSVTPNTVDHAIAEIRRALNDRQEPTRFIRTIAREGYCFIAQVTERIRHPKIAILPFVMVAPNGLQERVDIGLADALITRMCSLNKTVCSTAAVLKYAGSATSALEAGRELGADFVLEGLIQKANEMIRITLQLIQVCDAKALWAQTFDEKFTSIFSLEDAFVEQVTQALPSPFGVR
jgi:DNA-binding winged helix-turn-helix (wHTH) protein